MILYVLGTVWVVPGVEGHEVRPLVEESRKPLEQQTFRLETYRPISASIKDTFDINRSLIEISCLAPRTDLAASSA